MKTIKLVAEVKTMSPFGFKSDKSWDELFEIAAEHGDIISIHVNPQWGGSPGLIDKARNRTKKPILAKGMTWMVDDVHDYLRRGADHVLIYDTPNVLGFFEPHVCWLELGDKYTPQDIVFKKENTYVVNRRNPSTGEVVDHRNWNYIRRLHGGPLVQASMIKTIDDVRPDADMIIVGEHLPGFVKTL